jgi:hypothetical protein
VAAQLRHEQAERMHRLPQIVTRGGEKAGLGEAGEFELMGAFLEHLLGARELPHRVEDDAV